MHRHKRKSNSDARRGVPEEGPATYFTHHLYMGSVQGGWPPCTRERARCQSYIWLRMAARMGARVCGHGWPTHAHSRPTCLSLGIFDCAQHVSPSACMPRDAVRRRSRAWRGQLRAFASRTHNNRTSSSTQPTLPRCRIWAEQTNNCLFVPLGQCDEVHHTIAITAWIVTAAAFSTNGCGLSPVLHQPDQS
jgi:hypothetical protein